MTGNATPSNKTSIGKDFPSRVPSHKAADHRRLMKIGSDLEDIATGGTLSFNDIDSYSMEQGVPHGLLYAAAAMTTDLTFATDSEHIISVCAGNCQQWGALPLIDMLCDLRVSRQDNEQPVFSIVAVPCLDQCKKAPAIVGATPSGKALLTQKQHRDYPALQSTIASLLAE